MLGFGACLAYMRWCSSSLHDATAGSDMVWRYFLSTAVFSSANFLYTSYVSDMTDSSSIDISLTNIWRSWRAFRVGKKTSKEIIQFEAELEYNLLLLCRELHSGSYKHGTYRHRIVQERKRRDILVAHVRDRVVHRLLYDFLMPVANPRFDDDVYSCRPEKGLHKALTRTQRLLSRHHTSWVWRADVMKFFDHVSHEELRVCLARLAICDESRRLLDTVISSYCATGSDEHGIPIGNLTSQIFANIYLNEFDRFVRHELKPLAYVRYGDDFILFGRSKDDVAGFRDQSITFLRKRLHLRLHAKNNVIFRAKHGVKFLGHQLYPFSPISVDQKMMRDIDRLISPDNYPSYYAMHIPRRKRKHFAWRLLDKNLD